MRFTALALEIAKRYPDLQSTRNDAAVTPLQLMVTIPDAFGSKAELGFFEDLFYDYFIPVNEHIDEHGTRESDLEQQHETRESEQHEYWPTQHDSLLMRLRNKFPLLSIILIPANWIRLLIFRILKQSFHRVELLEQKKINHTQAMMLVEHLARDPKYWEFINMGWEGDSASFFLNTVGGDFGQQRIFPDDIEKQEKKASADSGRKRWADSPLTQGAKFGLHDLVERFLKVCPQSAFYLDLEGKNILQVAVQHGQLKIVKFILKMTWCADPVLLSWLLSNIHAKTKNTILHFASEVTIKEASISSLQMQDELRWFAYVRDLLPENLKYIRNVDEKTAQELFTEKHENMIAEARSNLQEKGKQYSSLVAAVVFASSFSIPGEQADRNNPDFYNKPAYKVFSHSYLIGLSCAATSFVLFLSLVTTEYREKDFRRSIPIKYTFASFTFFFALVALLVAFACNYYLSIYGGRKPDPKHLITFVCELAALPAICIVAVLKVGCDFGVIRTIRSLWD